MRIRFDPFLLGNQNRLPPRMTKSMECWGADRPFANITESKLARNIGLAVCIYYVVLLHQWTIVH